ncbi:MAG: MFS transporter [Clostridia bacterium]|nr:MFS transporter [Clostridia bacterium]
MKANNRWLRLIMATFALLLAGIIYAWSFFKAPIAQLYGWDGRAPGLQLNYTLTLCFFCLGGLAASFIGKKASIRTRMFIGAGLLCAGFVIVSLLTGNSPFLLYLSYGIMAGAGIGFVYNTIIGATTPWFPDKKGTASGIMMLGFGFSSLVLGNLAAKLFDVIGWENVFRLYGIGIGAVLAIIGCALRLPKDGEVPAAAAAAAGTGKDYSPKEMLLRPSFWMVFAVIMLINSVGSVAIGQSKDVIMGIDGSATALAGLAASLVSVMNGAGRFVWGALFDKIGMRRTQYVLCVVFVAAAAGMWLGVVAGSTVLAFIGICLAGMTYSYSPTATTTFTMGFYGKKHFQLNFALMMLTLIPGSFASTIVGGMSLTGSFAFLTVLAVIGAGINLMVKKA